MCQFFVTYNIMIWVGIAILTGMFVGGVRQRQFEIKAWNNGICAKTDLPWIHTDTDSQGGCHYTDHSRQYSCWISYGVDKHATNG